VRSAAVLCVVGAIEEGKGRFECMCLRLCVCFTVVSQGFSVYRLVFSLVFNLLIYSCESIHPYCMCVCVCVCVCVCKTGQKRQREGQSKSESQSKILDPKP
jgi:hypothetical protein